MRQKVCNTQLDTEEERVEVTIVVPRLNESRKQKVKRVRHMHVRTGQGTGRGHIVVNSGMFNYTTTAANAVSNC